MNSVIRYFALSTVFVLCFGNYSSGQVVKRNLSNFAQINANLYRGAQPSEAGVKELAQIGVKTIINLRGADEHSKAEEIWARNAGIKVISFDLSNWFEPKTSEIEKIIADIERTGNQPVFVHCKRGADRTGTVIAVYRITHDNWTAQRANDEAKTYGFGWWQIPMKHFISEYYEDFIK